MNITKAWIIQSLLWFQHSLSNNINVTTLPQPGIPDNTCKFPISSFFFCQYQTPFSTVMKKRRRKRKSILGLCWGYTPGEIFKMTTRNKIILGKYKIFFQFNKSVIFIIITSTNNSQYRLSSIKKLTGNLFLFISDFKLNRRCMIFIKCQLFNASMGSTHFNFLSFHHSSLG